MSLSLHNISFSYVDTDVVQDVSMVFEEGLFYAILGPNGCGKTTLLDLLIRHLKPRSGAIRLRGGDLKDYTIKEISKTIALVSQNYAVSFPFSVKEVVMMGRHPHMSRFSSPDVMDVAAVEEAMVLTGIEAYGERKITELSGGERQRCVVARALCQDTPFLFLDEAFSSMDIHHTLRLLHVIKDEVKKKKRTVVSVFHDINIASAWSDQLVFMKEGRVVAAGNGEVVLTKEIIKEVFEVDALVEKNAYVGAVQVCFKGDSHG